jgi:hypothetical protein
LFASFRFVRFWRGGQRFNAKARRRRDAIDGRIKIKIRIKMGGGWMRHGRFLLL